MSKIFINFRVGDGENAAVLIDDKLRKVVGDDLVFRSSRAIKPGSEFEPELIAAASECAVMIVVIGRNWLTASGHDGQPKLTAAGDWVRFEIELALSHGARVIPVLDGDIPMPTADQLPSTISALASRQYIRYHYRSSTYDLNQIADSVRALRLHGNGTPLPPPPESTMLTSLACAGRSSGEVRTTTAVINGVLYSDSVVFRPDLFCHDTNGIIDYNLGRQYRALEVMAGVLDDAVEPGQTGVFQVFLDGVMRTNVTATQGNPRFVQVDLTDVLRLRLLAYRPGTTKHPALAGAMLAGGKSNKLPELAWGNPKLYS